MAASSRRRARQDPDRGHVLERRDPGVDRARGGPTARCRRRACRAPPAPAPAPAGPPRSSRRSRRRTAGPGDPLRSRRRRGRAAGELQRRRAGGPARAPRRRPRAANWAASGPIVAGPQHEHPVAGPRAARPALRAARWPPGSTRAPARRRRRGGQRVQRRGGHRDLLGQRARLAAADADLDAVRAHVLASARQRPQGPQPSIVSPATRRPSPRRGPHPRRRRARPRTTRAPAASGSRRAPRAGRPSRR